MNIEICHICKGTGRKEEGDRFDDWTIHCIECNGTGKIHTHGFCCSISIPYTMNKDELYKYDSALHEVHRKFEAEFKKKKIDQLSKEAKRELKLDTIIDKSKGKKWS